MTDFWITDAGCIVKIMRGREPYEVELLEVLTPAG